MVKVTRVGILFGGRSGEHEVSVMSARSVFNALDRDRFEPAAIGISRKGLWYLIQEPEEVFSRGCVEDGCGLPVALLPLPYGRPFISLEGGSLPQLDVVFPVLHGTFGEDGTIQGLLELAGLPYVGAGVGASAVGMDKEMMKKAFRHAGLPVVDDVIVLRRALRKEPDAVFSFVEEKIPYPCFVKPANLGSSVGVSRATNRDELAAALTEAAQYDRKIIIEKGVTAREIECSVLGNDYPQCSIPGEIIPAREFYDYEAKYVSEDSQLVIPAALDQEVEVTVQNLAVRAFTAIGCSGLARVDFFITRGTGEVLVNEINTMPGFTKISMYPKLWEATGLPYGDLLTKLINLGLERFEDMKQNKITYQ